MQPINLPQPQPVQTMVNVQIVSMQDGTRAVVITLADCTGSKTAFFPADEAAKVGVMISDAGRQAGSGIVVAHSGAVPSLLGG